MYGLLDPDCPVDCDKLAASIKNHEGLRLHPYIDSTGHTTIGYGRNLQSVGISPTEAEYLLRNDLYYTISRAEEQSWWPLVKDNDARARAMCELCFNIGFAGIHEFVRFLSALSGGDYDTASVELLDSLWSRQVGKRAEVLAEMIKTGEDYRGG